MAFTDQVNNTEIPCNSLILRIKSQLRRLFLTVKDLDFQGHKIHIAAFWLVKKQLESS